jgi:hypothetical protein
MNNVIRRGDGLRSIVHLYKYGVPDGYRPIILISGAPIEDGLDILQRIKDTIDNPNVKVSGATIVVKHDIKFEVVYFLDK